MPGGGPSSQLRQARVPLVDLETCTASYQPVLSQDLGDGQLCAGKGTRDSCNGDSGGALLSSELGGRWAVVGVTSFGVDCAREDFPGVYTRVDRYLDWIRRQM